jgi:hypothetical protein
MLHKISIFYHPLLFIFLFTASITSCLQKERKKKEAMPQTPAAHYKKPPSSFTDTLVIRGPAAVFFTADTVQLEKIKAITEPQIFESTTHDCFFQQRNAKQVLKKYWPQIHIIDIADIRFLHFIGNKQEHIYRDLNEINDMCGLVLFKNGKLPEIADMMNVETALHTYFND